MTLSVAEVALVAEALAAWGKIIPSHHKLSERGGGSKREALPGDYIMHRRLPPAWSAAAVLHTMRLRVLLCAPAGRTLSEGLSPHEKDICKDTRQSLMSLVCSFRGLGCQAPQVWFEAVLEAEAELIRRDSPEEGEALLSDGVQVLKRNENSATAPTNVDGADTVLSRHQPSELRTRLLEVPGAVDAIRLLSSRRPELLHG